ncbi:MAG: signal peptidase II [Alphaproteobacteria bacterium]
MSDNLQERKEERALIREREQKNSALCKRLFWFIIAFLVFLSDQISKWAVTELLVRPNAMGQTGYNFLDWYNASPMILPYYGVKVTSFFNIVMAWNTGVSFSMFSEYGGYMPTILVFVALGITVLFMVWLWRAESNLHGFCYALVIGGALGNVIDRARYGAVIDFLDFHMMGYHWPAFNIADMAVVTGISLLIIVSLFFDIQAKDRYRKQRRKRRAHKNFLLKRFGR